MDNVDKPKVEVSSFKSLHITPVLNVVKQHKREALYATLFIFLIVSVPTEQPFDFFATILFVFACAGLAFVLYQLSRPLPIKTVALRCILVIFGFFALGYVFHEVVNFLSSEWGLIIVVALAIPLRLFARPIFYNLLAISLRQEKFTWKYLKHGFWNLVIWELLITLLGGLMGLIFLLVPLLSYAAPSMVWIFLGLTLILMLAMSSLHIVWLMAVAITAQDKAIRDARQKEIEELGFSSHIQKWADYSSIS